MDPQTGKLLKRNVDIKNVFFFFFFPYGITKKIIPNSRDEVNS